MRFPPPSSDWHTKWMRNKNFWHFFHQNFSSALRFFRFVFRVFRRRPTRFIPYMLACCLVLSHSVLGKRLIFPDTNNGATLRGDGDCANTAKLFTFQWENRPLMNTLKQNHTHRRNDRMLPYAGSSSASKYTHTRFRPTQKKEEETQNAGCCEGSGAKWLETMHAAVAAAIATLMGATNEKYTKNFFTFSSASSLSTLTSRKQLFLFRFRFAFFFRHLSSSLPPLFVPLFRVKKKMR